MNNKKIAFITAVTNIETYKECLFYIHSLDIPLGYEVECISIENNSSFAKSYNEAMEKSDAKYKVYLMQEVFIINKKFIYELLDIFEGDNSIGMIGALGSENMSTDAHWWKSPNRIGKVNHNHYNQMQSISLGENCNKYEEVNFIDGFIMATQYDIEWKEDLFKTSCFYDIAQCVEFKNRGYKLVVGLPEHTWCTYDCKEKEMSDDFEVYRNIFLDIYSKQIFPLVSILIAAYNQVEFLKIAIESVINQTYRNIEIIIGDDSTNGDVKKLVEEYTRKYDVIRYIDNNGPLGGNGKNNRINIFKEANGDYVSFLNHDDLYKEDRIAKMINYFNCDKSVSLVTSARNFIDKNGNVIYDSINEQRQPIKIDGIQAGRKLLLEMANFIGEPSTAIFKRNLIQDNLTDYNNQHIYAIGDVVTWLKVLKQGNLIYIYENLSSFRRHKSQNSSLDIIETLYGVDWYKLIKQVYEEKSFIWEQREYLGLLTIWYLKFINKLNISKFDNENSFNIKDISRDINEILKEYSESAQYECNYCKEKLISYKSLIRKEGRSDKVNNYIIENCNLDTYMCPNCLCTDRERMYLEYIEKHKNNEFNNKLNILHIAPELKLKDYISKKINKESVYVCGDLYPMSKDLFKIDVTDINFKSDIFDVIICSHVLEHVPDDKKAMEELYRVMKPGGWGILQVPIALDLNETYEDENINTDEERLYHFGQEDHVRVYGLDYIDRLVDVGFNVERYNCFENFGVDKVKELGLSKNDAIYIVKK